jgi:shikimate 5-dehydrogenase
MYFIGVDTNFSSIMKTFPLWSKELGLENVEVKGIEIPLKTDVVTYREVVEFIKNDPLSKGGLVATHKIGIYNACKHMFDDIDPLANKLGELSCIYKKGDKLIAHATDQISAGLAIESFLPNNFWQDHEGEVVLLGSGGSAVAIAEYFGQEKWGKNIPKITICNRSIPHLATVRENLAPIADVITLDLVHNATPKANSDLVSKTRPYSLIINATSLGKDSPGSPVVDSVVFPKNSYIWDINYRGNFTFLNQAKPQQQANNLQLEDGWIYFVHGWTQVISRVFNIEISGDTVQKLINIRR